MKKATDDNCIICSTPVPVRYVGTNSQGRDVYVCLDEMSMDDVEAHLKTHGSTPERKE